MLTDSSRYRRFALPAAFAILSVAGCSQLPTTQKHSSAQLLDSGTTTHVSRRQAADVQISMARTLEESDHLAEAEAGYREALKHDSKRADAHHRLAVLCDRKGESKEAETHYAAALKLDPKNPEILCDQAYGYYLQRRWADSEESLRQALAIAPRHARSHNNLGLVFARQVTPAAQVEIAGADRQA